MTKEERIKMLLLKAVEYLRDVGGYTLPINIEGYDGCDFDPQTLADDIEIEFDLDL